MVRFNVDKMGCGGCAKSVTRAVQAVEPGTQVEVDLQAKLVTVSEISGPANRIARAIGEAGFPAVPV